MLAVDVYHQYVDRKDFDALVVVVEVPVAAHKLPEKAFPLNCKESDKLANFFY